MMLEDDVLRLAFCWTIERRDGAGLALTSHDAMLTIDGVRYLPGAGLTPRTLRFDGSGEDETSAVSGAVSSALLDEQSLLAGRWDGSRVRLFLVDWAEPETGRVELLDGELGEIAKVGGEYEASLLTAFAKLDAPACPATSPLCRAELGDAKCRVAMDARRRTATVVSASGERIEVGMEAADGMTFGALRLLEGPQRGASFTVLAVEGGTLVLREAPRFAVDPGARVELTEGCDKTFTTCVQRFGNARNFRGEPHLPGADLLTRYPGA